jgi:signal peptidase I
MKLRTLIAVLVVGVAAIWSRPFLPASVGGNATYVTSYGTSMLPRFHPGDLAIVKPASQYRVGDVVAYHSATLHGATVLHRVVTIDAGRFTLKGDKNNFIDPDHPTAEQLVGRLFVRIPHVGAIRSWILQPVVLFPLLGLTLALVCAAGVTFGTRRRRSRLRGPRRAGRGFTRVGCRNRVPIVVLFSACVATAGCLVVAVAVWNVPLREHASVADRYRHTVTLGYSGTAAAGAAYPDGKIRTGDPVFTRLVRSVQLDMAFDFAADGRARTVNGSYDVVAHIASSSGWQREIMLAAGGAFTGDHVARVAILDLDAVKRMQGQFAAETGLSSTQATVSIAARLHVAAAIGDTAVDTDNSAKLEFVLTPAAMTLTRPQSAAPLGSSTKSGTVQVATTQPHLLSLWRVAIPVELARLLSIVAMSALLAAAAMAVVVHRRRVAGGEIGAILLRYGKLLVSTRELPTAGTREVVHVGSMGALVQLADQRDDLILHGPSAASHRFTLLTPAAVYVYDIDPPAEEPTEAVLTTS